MFLQTVIHSGVRRIIGLGLVLFGVSSAVFYYAEMNTVSKAMSNTATTVRYPTAPTALPASPVVHKTEPPVKGKIKLSTATQAELESLPKIGPTKALAILAYRNAHGFKSVNDLDKVKGIGPKTLELLRPLVEL